MAFGTFDLVIGGEQQDGTPENKARLYLRSQGSGILRDEAGNEFKFPTAFAKAGGVAISLPYTITLFTDSTSGDSTTIGYEGYVADDFERMSFTFAAPQAGLTVNLVDLTDSVVIPIADTQLFRDEAEAARDEAVAAAASIDPDQFARFGPTPQAHGAVGNGVANDTAALQAWLAAGYATGFIPPGTYLTTAALVQPATMDVTFAQGATIKASSAISGAVWTAGSLTSAMRSKKLIRPTIDCNGVATTGLFFPYFGTFTVESPRVISAAGDSIIVGDPGATAASYELSMSNVKVERPSASSVPAGSRGIWMRYAQDSRIHGENSILGADIGIRMDRGSNQFQDVHVWGYAGKEPTICFDDAAGHNVYYGCMADSPKQYGWKFTAFKARLFFCHAYIGVNYPTLDNVVTGMYTTLDAPDIDLVGCHFEGGDGTHRLAKDFDGLTALWTSTVNATGTLWDNVVTKNIAQANQLGATRFRGLVQLLVDNSNALGVRDSSGAYILNVNTSSGSRRIEAHNGAELRGYSDAGTTQQWRISGTTGAVRFGRYTTAGRPTGGALQQDDYIHDLTIGKLIRWDGTNWRDTANNIV